MGAAVVKKTASFTPFQAEDGPIFTDGSCLDPSGTHPRAGFSAVQIDDAGTVIKAVYGTVPLGWKQDANVAEHFGIIHADGHAADGTTAVVDCKAVTSAWSNGLTWAAGPRRPQGGFWREMSFRISQGRSFAGVEKIKAHRDIDQLEGVDRWRAQGNRQADIHAKM
eukprot:3695670-Karenia_brevis.AAC.1